MLSPIQCTLLTYGWPCTVLQLSSAISVRINCLRHFAIQAVCIIIPLYREVAMAIVKGSKWAAAMRNVTQEQWGGETTPLRKLIRKMPGESR